MPKGISLWHWFCSTSKLSDWIFSLNQIKTNQKPILIGSLGYIHLLRLIRVLGLTRLTRRSTKSFIDSEQFSSTSFQILKRDKDHLAALNRT